MDNWIIQLIAPVVISTVVGALGFFIKSSLTKVESGIKENNTKIDNLDKKYEKKLREVKTDNESKITAVEDKFDEKIDGIKKEISNLRADLPFVFVPKEDFIRTLNGIESKMSNIDSKLDRLILK